MKTNAIPSYQDELSQVRDNLKKMLPPAALSAFDNYAIELNGTLKNILKVKTRDTAPAFTLNNQSGNTIALAGLLQRSKVILVFYRGGWCPFCNLQLNQLQAAADAFASHNARLVAISPQMPDASLSMIEKNKLNFEILSDIGNIVARKFTTVFRHNDPATAVLQSLGIDFSHFYGDDSQEIPVPAVFVIQQDGAISFAKSEGGDYRNRVKVAEILNAL